MTSTIQTALFIAIVGILGIFIFMIIFYLLIKGLDKWFPYKEEKPEQDFVLDEIED
ncbi:MAG: OadG-related small transporter subunit [Fermentimonas sp.]|nr:OadG-related small transporter subunit [Fermentimonas sp.]